MSTVISESDIGYLLAQGIPEITARAIIALLELHDMQSYLGFYSGAGGEPTGQWRVQYNRHAYGFHYTRVKSPATELMHWFSAVEECEKTFQHIGRR